MQSLNARAPGVLVAAALILAGCQPYEPRPLDLDAHRAAWLDRSPASESVAAFARRLATPDEANPTFDAADGISRREAEVIALVFNPDLRLARARADIATATAEHAGRWDDPVFEIDVLRITESVANPWIVSPGLSFTIPLSGRLDVEKARADAARCAALAGVVEAEWRTRHEVQHAWIEWAATGLRLEETERLVATLDALVASTGRLADAGEMPRTEASLFAIEQAQRRHDVRRLKGELAEGEQRLRALMGLAPVAPLVLLRSLGETEAPPTWWDEALPARNPTLTRMRDEYAVAEEALHREIRKQYPDLAIGPQYESDEGQSRVGLLGAIPLPLLNANRQGIAEAEAERELARAAFETEFERLAGALALSRIRAATLAERRADIGAELVPLVDRQLDDARRLLALGERAGLVLLESLARAHATKLALVDVGREEARTRADIEHLIGPPAPPALASEARDASTEAAGEVTP